MKYQAAQFENGSDDFPTCSVCQADLVWEDCWKCGGEGGRDLYEEDPLANAPGDWETCDECDGRGFHDYCPEARKHSGVSA